ncbi:sulfatase-like hydrolase/transferase [Paenibacillus sp. LMG 31456]|uniref:Sulfatase-like hydrolase/transferase n=1 Tax=Paenibacillus foliorum TaxID=2654974 RepID=A0A972GWP6_9BACL|nr:LTA synthase family protein [Paenibacillus foliorum]NOU95894.1 sulfatase-like hydrolase/transferase [Paenibacillus foliorum]
MRPRRRKQAGPALNRLWSTFFIVLACAVVPLVLVFGVEFIQRGNLHETWAWLIQNPKLFTMNALLDLFVFLLIYALLGNLLPSVALSILLLCSMSFISYFKVKLIGEPFFPWDIFLNKESMNVLPLVTNQSALLRIGTMLGAVFVLLLMSFLLPRLRLRIKTRVAVGLVAVFAVYSFGVNAPWASRFMDRMGANEIVWNQSENYGNNGMALAFTMNVKNAIVPKPAGYDEPTMANLAQMLMMNQSGLQTASAKADPFNGKQPNVIFIMSEAFWDPTLLPNVTFSEDPAPTVHRLQQESTSGYLLSPQFGGGTSNVEYEVLTGQSMSFLPAGSVPYQQYISQPLPSLAGYFEEQGYKSMAIHSYEGWFWNRENVYKEMGFESFMSKDQFSNPQYKGDFISDDEVANSIIQQVDSTDKPMFIYTVTMQNHGPYDDQRYGSNPIQVEGNLTPEAKDTLETYTQGVQDADASLQKLIDHFDETGEPTVIVFYGDHLPMLGYDYDVYTQAGFIQTGKSQDWTLEELKKMHSVPFVTWSNVDLPQEQLPVLSNSFLGAYMLSHMGMQLPETLAYNVELSQKMPGMLRNLVVDANQNLYPAVPDSLKEDVDKYRQLQYDGLFGKQYLAKYIGSPYLQQNVLPNYNQEFVEKAPVDEDIDGSLNASGEENPN